MNIDSIQNGIVLDHISAGKALQIYNDLHLDKLDCSVAIIKNVKSAKMGKKDILKIDQNIDINLDVLGYIDPDISVNIIKDGKLVEKKKNRASGTTYRHPKMHKSTLHYLYGAGHSAYIQTYRQKTPDLPLHLLRSR